MENRYYLNPEALAMHFHPGETLSEKLQEMAMNAEDFAIKAQMPLNVVELVLAGRCAVTMELATSFEKVTEIPVSFWLNKQRGYDEYCQRQNAQSQKKHVSHMRRDVACEV